MQKFRNIEKLQKIVTPIIISVTVAVGTITGFVQIHQRTVRRKKWFAPVTIIVALVLAGFIGAVIERVIIEQPRLQCLNGSYAGDDGKLTCRAVLSTSVPIGATARCNDGSYSFNRSSTSICSHHGGLQASLQPAHF